MGSICSGADLSATGSGYARLGVACGSVYRIGPRWLCLPVRTSPDLPSPSIAGAGDGISPFFYCESLPNLPGKVGVREGEIIDVNVVAIFGSIDHVLFWSDYLGSKLCYCHIWEQSILLPFVLQVFELRVCRPGFFFFFLKKICNQVG